MYSPSDLVSIAMATYNGERYLAEQLDSILGQTHKNIELVITDDGSSDGTTDIIKNYAERYPFIRLYQNPRNLGITKTFENALQHCTGKYIAIADQDDVWAADKLETLAASISTEDAAYGNSLFVDAGGKSQGIDFKSVMHLQSYYSGAPFLLGNCLPGHSFVMTQAFVKTLFPFPDGIMYDRWISFKAAANNGIKYTDRHLVFYRQHGRNAVGTKQNRSAAAVKKTTPAYERKLNELVTYKNTAFKSEATRRILERMLQLFHKRPSLARSLFFFKNFNTILIVKNKSTVGKILFCIKMFFKANY